MPNLIEVYDWRCQRKERIKLYQEDDFINDLHRDHNKKCQIILLQFSFKDS